MPLNAEQLATLIEQHGAVLKVWARTWCSESEDVVQEAFCRLAAAEPTPDNPVAWLYKVCRNLSARQRLSDSRRRRRERERQVPAPVSASPADDAERAEAVAAVERLDAPLREVVVARIWGGLTLDEVADVCVISTATAFRRYQAALNQLRTQLEPEARRLP